MSYYITTALQVLILIFVAHSAVFFFLAGRKYRQVTDSHARDLDAQRVVLTLHERRHASFAERLSVQDAAIGELLARFQQLEESWYRQQAEQLAAEIAQVQDRVEQARGEVAAEVEERARRAEEIARGVQATGRHLQPAPELEPEPEPKAPPIPGTFPWPAGQPALIELAAPEQEEGPVE